MKELKYGCAVLAAVYLAFALLPSSILTSLPSTKVDWAPECLDRVIAFALFLILGIIFYGIQKRAPLFWNLIPILTYMFILTFIVSTFLTLIELSLPWAPFVAVSFFLLIAPLWFYSWWRKQRAYFN